MEKKLKRQNYFSFSPLILLAWGILSMLFIPVIQIASGFGWDGVFYAKVALNFPNLIGKMDSYHAGRIFPGLLVYYLLVLFKIPLTLKAALIVFQTYYIFILFFSSVVWVKIAKLMNLNYTNSWVGFIALFISYPVLNWYFYYPSLTDGTTLFLAILLIYCYLKPNNFLLFLITVLSYFSWPTGIVMCFFVFIYRRTENLYWGANTKKLSRFIFVLILLAPILVLILFCSNANTITSIIIQLNLKGGVFNQLRLTNKGVYYNYVRILNSLILVAYIVFMYWVILKDFNFLKFLRLHFKKEIYVRCVIFFFFLALLVILKRTLYNPLLPTVTAFAGYAYPAIKLSSRYAAQFLVSHIAYWGPSIFLLLFFFKQFVYNLKTRNLPIALGFIFTIIFSINAESRSITNYFPFIIFVIVQSVDFSKLRHRNLFVCLFLGISLICSKIWLPITLPATVYPVTLEANLDKFPLQWYFMNFGLWMNYQMYLLHLVLAVVFGFCLYFTVRNFKSIN